MMELSCVHDDCETVERFRVTTALDGGSLLHYALVSLRSRSGRCSMCFEWRALRAQLRELHADERALLHALNGMNNKTTI